MEPIDGLRTFRLPFYECFHRRSDTLFELAEGRNGLGMGAGRGVRTQDIEVRRRANEGTGDEGAAELRIRRTCPRYEDGKVVCFDPEAGEEFFRDDAHRLVGMLPTDSEDLEWGLCIMLTPTPKNAHPVPVFARRVAVRLQQEGPDPKRRVSRFSCVRKMRRVDDALSN